MNAPPAYPRAATGDDPRASTVAVHDPARLRALRECALLDTVSEPAFDRLTRLATVVLGVPTALVSLVDADRQFFKSAIGLCEPWNSLRETPLSHSFCQHVVARAQPLIINDARDHPLVRENLAVRDLNVVAYAGIPLTTSDEFVLGSFCAIDTQPRDWSSREIDILTDLAAAAMTEIELLATHRAAQEANRAKSRLVSDVAHEMRTPLTSLRGSLGLLVNRAVPPESERALKMLRIALGNTERLIRLINDRLDLDKIEAGQLEFDRRSHEPRELVDEAARNVVDMANEHNVRIAVDGNAPPVLADQDRIVQVLVNLLGNAVKFSPAQGTVTVRITSDSDTARFAISDEGPGIGGEVRHKLFERFRQLRTSETSGSTGLGLAISKAIVAEHGGTIDVESELGQGSTFWFTVPLHKAE